ncbi:lysylphosphatidylglycerol synthase transmembrane domain-containing protein [Vagococcus hydrophili]|uniref:Phosphatidylglycerol lysyltransferase n=1 Tax=Vagococcus hydrophili TaxID=2714947 RepID=A0A6G8AQY4_9ENTE|nr:lysylphosphatidylglycerol synthase transmembrane domain-containing protein [Vagococcus hydrophili]QIL47379.1 flippase-like domain-containing protein [Vagococcus hydrophili]
MNRKNIIYLGIAFLLGGVVIWNELRKVSLSEVYLELVTIKWQWLVVAVICMLLHWAVEARMIQLFLKRSNPDFSFKNAFRIPLIEHLFNAITPFSTGGQPAQILALGKSGVDYGVSASVSLMKFVIYQIWIVVNFVLCIILGFHWVSGNLEKLSYFILIGFAIHFFVVFCLLMVMFWHTGTQKIVNGFFNLARRFKIGRKLERKRESTLAKMDNFYEHSRYMKNEPVLMLKTSILTIAQLLVYYIVPYFILLALNTEDVNVLKVIVFHAFIIMIISLFPIPGGAGGAEYSFTLLFGTFVVIKSKLVLAIFLWRIVTYYMGIILGLIALVIQPDLDGNKVPESDT